MNKALVEASAGSLGALFACLVLFPLDVAKTKQQASTEKGKKQTALDLIKSIYKKHGIQGLFSGLGPKASHTILSNFFYFYWYSWLKNAYERSYGHLTTSVNLAIGAIAGAINMSITLPLDVISTRIQTSKSINISIYSILIEMYNENGILSFWSGFIPSLVLVTNPSIFYTIFDRLKHRIARELTAFESFLIAAIAKSIATILTYPIIRAKVIMQSEKSNEKKTSMLHVLERIWKQDGIDGYYRGCYTQLFNTVFKSALLLMSKEEISKLTIRLLEPFQKLKK